MTTLKLKDGVSLDGLTLPAIRIISAGLEVWAEQNVDVFWITSGTDGRHREDSKHYTGEALDIRRWNVYDVERAAKRLREVLGPDYDVVVERDHLYVEWDPKRVLTTP